MANIKDFAAGIVVTPPSPATSGTSITLRAGDGATMPTAPFYVTATPPGQLTTLGTSEKLLVTAVSGDTLTVTRAQTPTSAKSIDTNWVVANAMYVDDVMKSNIATDQLLTGTVNGSNTVFTTASTFTAIQVYKNGVAMHIGDDFTVTGGNQITMVTAPATGTKLTATYIIGSQIMIAGSNSTKSDETPTGTVNGSNTSFTTLTPYIANTLQVYVNGVKQKRGTHFSEVTPTSGTFTISDAPLTNDDVMVEYQFVQSVAGNADTLDGYHANATPTANNIPVLDGDAKLNVKALTSLVLGTATITTPLAWPGSGEPTIVSLTVDITQDMVDSGRKLKLNFFAPQLYSNDAASRVKITIYEGSTVLARTYQPSQTGSTMAFTVNISSPAMPMPSVGSHTYTAKFTRDVGTGTPTLYTEAGTPIYLEAEIK